MNRERLEHQIELLRTIALHHLPFEMDAWMSDTPAIGFTEEACGTAACAFGYACLDPTFKAAGLRLDFILADIKAPERHTTIATVADYNATRHIPGTFQPVWGDHQGFSAAAVFYDISYDAATFLFDPSAYRDTFITPEMVIEHVEHVLAELEIPEEEFDHRDDDEGTDPDEVEL